MAWVEKGNIKNDMRNMSNRFPDFYRKYFNDSYDDTDLQEMTTQPFWQSMRLSKKRLQSKGLCMDVELTGDSAKEGISEEYTTVREDGSNLAGIHRENVLARRKFYKDGKAITDDKEYEQLYISMLQGTISDDTATCPNCGYVGKISDFIDGCDACGSLFSVKDFETKVSGFSLEENTWRKLKGTIKKTAITLAVITVGLMLLGAGFLGLLIYLLMIGENGLGAVGSVFGLMFAWDMVPVGFRCLVTLWVFYIVMYLVLATIYRKRYRGEEKVQLLIPEFSAEDFCQNLEYKLRNIHMTDSDGEVAAFAQCSLERIIEKYADVVECHVTRCVFKQAYENNDGYCVRADVTMRLALFKRKRIRNKYEKISLTLYGRKEVVHRESMALREYKCKGCASSINILEGNTCRYCGAAFDYSDYGWVINEYRINRKPANIHKLASFFLIGVYVIIFMLHLAFVKGDKENDTWLSLYQEFAMTEEQIRGLYDGVPMPDVIDDTVKLADSHYDIVSMKNVYEVEDGKNLAIQYLTCVIEYGYTYYEEYSQGDSYVLYKREILEGEEGYIKLTIIAEDDIMEVRMDAVTEIGE